MIIEKINTGGRTVLFKLLCEKSGKSFERSKVKELTGIYSLGNAEKRLCDEEIVKFKKWMGDKTKADCWCKHLDEFINN